MEVLEGLVDDLDGVLVGLGEDVNDFLIDVADLDFEYLCFFPPCRYGRSGGDWL